LYASNDYTIIFEGSDLHSGLYSFDVTLTDGAEIPENRGYNLVGNPYPSAIDADAFIDRNNSIIEGTLYFWNDANGDGVFEQSDYATWNGSGSTGVGGGQRPNGKIGAHQGFMVKSQVASGTVYFENYMRDKENTQFFRPSAQSVLKRIRIQVNNDRNFSETLIAFRDDATLGFDPLYDGRKLIGQHHLNLYTKVNNSYLAIQSFPDDVLNRREGFSVPLILEVGQEGNYVMSVNMFENLHDYNVILKDHQTGTETLLGQNISYLFHSDSGTFKDRFELIFKLKTLKEEQESFVSGIRLYPNPARDFIEISLKEKTGAQFRIIDLQGKTVATFNPAPGNVYKLHIGNLSKGIYILQIHTEEGNRNLEFIKK
jgi:hypothetical protein